MVEVVTFGCRMNSFESEDSQRKLAELENVIVVNTCAVTGEAERQCRQAIRKLRKENPEARIIVDPVVRLRLLRRNMPECLRWIWCSAIKKKQRLKSILPES